MNDGWDRRADGMAYVLRPESVIHQFKRKA